MKQTITDPRGYKLLYVGKDHHLADVRGYAYEHRLIAEKMLGRKLLEGEVIHHKGDVGDNRECMLQIFPSNGAHLSFELRTRTDLQPYGGENETVFCGCGCGASFLKYDSYRRPRKYLSGHARTGKTRFTPTLVFCACGCGANFNKYDNYGRTRRFLPNHGKRKSIPNHDEQKASVQCELENSIKPQ